MRKPWMQYSGTVTGAERRNKNAPPKAATFREAVEKKGSCIFYVSTLILPERSVKIKWYKYQMTQ